MNRILAAIWPAILGRLVFALALMAFALMPAVDKALCAADDIQAPSASAAVIVSAPDSHPAHNESPSGGLCAHGHYHSASIGTPDGAPLLIALYVRPSDKAGALDAPLFKSATPPGLMRPPRV
jgi:hypothetical protein